jgi:Flp pilus assembly protein TadG
MSVLLGIGGLAVDVGHVLYVKNRVQAAADAAALAGAQDIGNGASSATIQGTVTAYSAVAGNKNALLAMPITMVSGYPQLKCLSSTGVPCVPISGGTAANAIVVQQTATVPLILGRVVGFSSMTVTATATASAAGGFAQPLNVMFVLDTTASMNTADTSCSISNASRVTCALAGIRTILGQLAPSIDAVGLMVYPGLKNSSQVQYEYDCSTRSSPQVAPYNQTSPTPVYTIIDFASDFRSSDTSSSLNTSSNLVKAVQGGGSGCAQGLTAVGGVGTFYADAITGAQRALSAYATGTRANVQNVMVLLSDGDAQSDTAPDARQECHQAITAAQAATAAVTWVYSIAYGASTTPHSRVNSGSCSTGSSPAISACDTTEQIASDPSKFFSDTVGGSSTCTSSANSVSELVSIFKRIGTSLLNARLIPDETT